MLEVVGFEGTRAQEVQVKVLKVLCSTIMTGLTEDRGIVRALYVMTSFF